MIRAAIFSIVILWTLEAAQAQSAWFEPNRGQVHRSVQFLARSGGGYVYFGRNRMAVRDVRMDLIGANGRAEAEFDDPTGGISSYFIGRTEKDWHTGIPHYARVRYKDVYSGIDLVYYGNQRDIEYDFVLRPGADPNQIRVAYNKPVRLDENGDLLIAGLRQRRPKVYQNGREIACEYLVGKRNEVHLALAEYDHSQALTVDPVLEFSTYVGGPGDDYIADIKVDSAGFVYLTGASQSPQAPTLDPFQQSTLITLAPFVLKMTGDGQHVVYYAVLGANGYDDAKGIVVDISGSPTIVGRTRSSNFPLKNAFQTQFKGAYDNAFVTRLTADGKSLVYSTYFGGTTWEIPWGGAAIDSTGNVWLAGSTESRDFPVKNPLQGSLNGYMDCFVAKFSPAGALLFATYWGGSALDNVLGIAVDARDNVYLAGLTASSDFPLRNAVGTSGTPRTGFASPILFKLSPDGQSVLFSTYLGDTASGIARGIAFDGAANIYVTGEVDDPSFQTTSGALQPASGGRADIFLIKLDPSASKVLYSTYLGGSGDDGAHSVQVDGNGFIYLSGYTSSPDLPVKNPLQQFRGGGNLNRDLFVAKIAPSGSLVYSTPLGGSGNEIPGRLALAPAGAVYVTGTTASMDFPVQNAYQKGYGGGTDGIFAKISDSTPIEPSPLKASPGILVFRYVQGGAALPAQVVSVTGGTFVAGTSVQWMGLTTQETSVSVSVNPAGLTPGTYNGSVVLTPSAGTPATVDLTLTVLAAAPMLTSINPTLVAVGSDDTTITLHGSGFTPASIVLFGGISWTVTPVQFIDSSTLKFSVPAIQFTAAYNYAISVQNPQSAVSNTLSLAVGVPAPSFTAASVVNAASFAGSSVAPGEIVTIFGTNLAGTVTFDNIPAIVVYSSATQISATVPYGVRGPKTSLQVGYSLPVSLNVTDAVPAIFTADASGKGQGAALNRDYTVNGASHAALVGSFVALYGTGGGTLTTDALPRLALPVTATVGGLSTTVYYAGIAPGLVQGAMQINVLIPAGVSAGPAVPVVVKVGDKSSPPVTIAVQ